MRFALGLLMAVLPVAAETPSPLTNYLNGYAQRHLAARKEAIAALRTPADIERRKTEVRAKILREIGGLPSYNGPLKAVTTGTLDRGTYWIEKVHFESLPNYIVTANLYRPKAAGKHPAVLFSIGHWAEGKVAGQRICANLAAKGFVVLAYDPVGQGERQQAYDARLGRSLIGWATEQHFAAGAQALLAGESVARYFIHDSKRAIDYLVSRPEVDATKIGASGCSGGGTQTTYISALDERVKVAAPACYMNSFEILFPGDIGDSEQSFPNFLADGLDQSDWVLLFAPKPWLISSTEKDFFTPAGARVVFEQARNFYEVMRAQDKVKWVVGPGGHGTPLVVREAIYEWMIRWLQDGKGDAKELDLPLVLPGELLVYPNGIAPGRGLTEIIEEGWRARKGPLAAPYHVAPDLSGAPTGLTHTRWLGPETKGELFVVVEDGGAARRRAEVLASLGCRVLLVELPGYPLPNGTYSGGWIHHTRAWLAGLNLPAIRARDLLAVIRPQLGAYEKVYLHAWGVGAFPAMLAFGAEPRIAKLWLERTPVSLESALKTPVHRNLHEAVIPGAAVEGGLYPKPSRRLFFVDPADWNENVLVSPGPEYYSRPFEQPDAELLAAFRKH